MKCGDRMPLGEIAPAASNPLPGDSQTVWSLSLEDVESRTGRILNRSHLKVSELGSTKIAFDERHVLYSKLRPYLNKVVLPERAGVATSELIPLLPDDTRVDREYLASYLRSPEFMEFANANTRGANLPRIAMTELWRHEIPLPPIKEQRRIVARIKECMARVDEIAALRGETLREYVALQTALLGAVIEPKEWPSMKIDNLVTTTRNGRSISTSNEDATGFVLSLSAVREINLNPTAKKPIVLPPNILEKYRVRDGDVFVSRSNTHELVGLASVATENVDDCIYPDLLIKLAPNTGIILPRFLAYALRMPSARAQIRERASGTSQSMVKISGARLKDVEIPVPPLEVQVTLIERLDQVYDRASDLLVDLKAPEIGQLRESILRKAFAGEL